MAGNGERTYSEWLHAMQSGVAMKMNHEPAETQPKHLRVGVNAAMSDQAGLARLLVEKGVITEAEYVAAITESMKVEAMTYEKWLSDHMNANIKLH